MDFLRKDKGRGERVCTNIDNLKTLLKKLIRLLRQMMPNPTLRAPIRLINMNSRRRTPSTTAYIADISWCATDRMVEDKNARCTRSSKKKKNLLAHLNLHLHL